MTASYHGSLATCCLGVIKASESRGEGVFTDFNSRYMPTSQSALSVRHCPFEAAASNLMRKPLRTHKVLPHC